jgi:4-aminobutyrate aminotransferase-like enzyme
LLERGRRIGKVFTDALNAMKEKYELIGDIRGPGLMIGIELVKDKKTKEPAREAAHAFVNEGLKRGVIFGESKYLKLGNVVKIKPPMVISESQVEHVLGVVEEITQQLSK